MRGKRGERHGPDHGVSGGSAPVQIRVAKWGTRNGRPRWGVVLSGDSIPGGRRFVEAPTETDAEALAGRLIVDIQAGALLDTESGPTPTRLGPLLEAWRLERAEDTRLASCTQANYRRATRALARVLGEAPLYTLSRATMIRYVQDRRRTVKPPTIAHEVQILGMVLSWARRRGWWQGQDPAELLRDLGIGSGTSRRALSHEETDALRATPMSDVFRLGFEACLSAGLRIGEAITRRWQDWDRTLGMLTIGDVPEIGYRPKGRRARAVPLTAGLSRLLTEAWMRAGQPKTGWILRTVGGERFCGPDRFEVQMAQACRTAGVDHAPVHALRHTYGSRLIEAGVDLVTVSRILGHANTKITEGRYIHVFQHQLSAAAGRLDALEAAREAATNAATSRRA